MVIAFENIPKEFVSKTAFYDYKAPMTEILGNLKSYGTVILTKDDEYYGIIDDRSIARKGKISLGKKEAAGKFVTKAPYLDQQTSLAKAINDFYESRAKALPYFEGNKPIGVVKRDEILKAILSMHMLSGYKTGNVMSTPVIAVDENTTVADASSMMRQKGINRLIVTSEGRLFGIITYRHILQNTGKLQERGATTLESTIPMGRKVSEIAERNVESIGHNESMDSAIRNIVEKRVSSLMVTRSGKPVGMLTPRDIFAAAVASNAEAAEGVILSGIDSDTKQYEEDILEEAEKLIEKIDKFTKLKVANLAIHVRKHKVRNYEIQARLWLEHSGAYSVSGQGYSIEGTVKNVMESLYKEVRNKKEIIYMEKKHGKEEEEED
jgi:predicted transcriptional regulator